MKGKQRDNGTDRASPQNDAQVHRPKPATSGQGLPRIARARLTKLVPVKFRFATWNIGSLTGRSRELADVLERRRVKVAFLQETRWRGNKSRKIGQGYQLIYSGSSSGRNGVAVVLSSELQEGILEVDRRSDRLVRVKVLIEGVVTNLISAYAPQVGCPESVKDAFWMLFDDTIRSVPQSESIVVGGDLNGHVGGVSGVYGRVHGGYGFGAQNAEGEAILRACAASDLAVVNTFYQKKPDHLITYRSGNHSSQIDYLLLRRCHISKVTNCKVIPGESLTPQHRLLVMDVKVVPKRKMPERRLPRIKWWLLEGPKQLDFRGAAIAQLQSVRTGSVGEQWNGIQKAITALGKSKLGVTKGGQVLDRETWWWGETVRGATREKKARFKLWQATDSPEDRAAYRVAKHAAKRAVAKARSEFLAPLYEKLETAEGQKLIYRLAKTREKATHDITKCRCVRDSRGVLVCESGAVKERWRSYFHSLMNTQYVDVSPPEAPPNRGLVAPISPDEILNSLRRMKNRKAVGPDNIPIEAWKALGSHGVDILAALFNRILDTKQMPDPWRLSYITPVYKGKGSVQDCGNYRGIKLMSHTMKLFERVLDFRLRQECTVSECQYGFRPGSGTTDPVFALRVLVEAYRSKKMPLHIAFLDLQKAFDCVPRQVIWWALRVKGVPQAYIDIIGDMYLRSESSVRTAVGDTTPFPVTVGVHQGSALSPLLFSVVLDAITAGIQEQPPWVLMYADDIALVDEDKQRLEQRVNLWKGTLENGGLILNVAKTEYMACGSTDSDSIRVGNELAVKTDKFKYLGSVLHESGDIDSDVKSRIGAAWAKWREVTGVTCDRKVPVRLKGLIYKSIIRPVLLYGCETWPALKRHVKEIHVAEMKMLRWMCNVTRLDRIRNVHIRGSLGVRDVADKLQECRLRWYGHVLRKPQEHVGRRCLSLALPGPRTRGRPKKRWLGVLGDDMRANGLTIEDAEDRAKWKRLSRKADPGFRPG